MVAALAPAPALLLASALLASPLSLAPAPALDPFEVAERVLLDRLGNGDGPADQTLQQLRSLAAARSLLALLDSPQGTPLEQTVALALEATRFQAEALGQQPRLPAPRTLESPAAGLRELAARHGAAVTPEQEAKLADLDQLPAEARAALAAFVAAFLDLDAASRAAFAGHTPQPTPPTPAGPWASPPDLSFDAVPILAARSTFLATLPPLEKALGGLAGPQSHSATLSVPPAFSIDLAGDPDTFAANEPFALILDAGGNDVYLNNAGGNNLFATCVALLVPMGPLVPAAALVDLGEGTDQYGNPANPGSCGVNGGGSYGVGLVVDGGGNDRYVAAHTGANGGTFQGIGLVLDAGGNDVYEAGVGLSCAGACMPGSNGVNGGGGRGLLIDRNGSDRYEAGTGLTCSGRCDVGSGNVNGGGGMLVDGDGADLYLAGVDASCGLASICAIGSQGVNGGGGFLLDAGAGDDRYTAGVRVQCHSLADPPTTQSSCWAGSLGANGGRGALFDAGGNDRYEAGVGADFLCEDSTEATSGILCIVGSAGTNGGGHLGNAGLLLDLFGDDTYLSGTASSVSCSGPHPLLPPLTASFDVGSLGVNGGAYLASGLLVDGTGRDTYQAGSGSTLACPALGLLSLYAVAMDPDGVGKHGVNGGTGTLSSAAANLDSDWWPGAGLLFDGGGFGDTYADNEGGTGTDKSVVPKGTFGAQLDCEGVAPPSCL